VGSNPTPASIFLAAIYTAGKTTVSRDNPAWSRVQVITFQQFREHPGHCWLFLKGKTMKKAIIVIMFLIFFLVLVCVLLFNYDLQTRYVQLENSTGQQIVFLGAMHCGSLAYFENLQKVLDRFSGIVLYEGVRDGDGLEPVMKPYRLMVDLLDVSYQGNAINYNPVWKLSDITMQEMTGKVDLRETEDQCRQLESWIVKKNTAVNPAPLKKFYKDLIEIVSLSVLLNPIDPLITVRNNKPTQEAAHLLSEGYNVLFFYGDAHFKIIDHFRKSGFKKISEKYFKVF
jgi:hypothetical protein